MDLQNICKGIVHQGKSSEIAFNVLQPLPVPSVPAPSFEGKEFWMCALFTFLHGSC